MKYDELSRVHKVESNETKTLKSTTFTKDGGHYNKLNDTLEALNRLERINWEELPTKYLACLVRILIGVCKQDYELQVKDTDIISRLETEVSELAKLP